MSKKPLFKRPIFWLSLLIIAATPTTYYLMGGFNPIIIKTVSVDNYYLIGKQFQGTYKSDTIQLYFSEMKTYLEQGTFEGPITIIYDQEPLGNRGYIKSFIGIRTLKAMTPSPGLIVRSIEASQAIQVSKECHSALMPNPHEIAKFIAEEAREKSVKSLSFNIEMYYPNNRLVIERPLLP